MDPQETLNRILYANGEGLVEDAFEACEELLEWLKKGGFAPNIPLRTYISIGNGGPVIYSILSHPNGSGTFIRYQYSNMTGMMEESHKYICPSEKQ